MRGDTDPTGGGWLGALIKLFPNSAWVRWIVVVTGVGGVVIVLSIALIALGELVARLSPQVERLLSAVHINPDWSQGITFGAVALVTVGVVTWILTRKVSVLTHNSIVLGGRVEAVVSLIDMVKQMADQNAREIAQLGQQAAEIKKSMGGTDESGTSHLKNYGRKLELPKS